MRTHLEQAIAYYKDLAELNLNIFGKIVADLLRENQIQNTRELDNFVRLYDYSTNETLKYEIVDGDAIIRTEKETGIDLPADKSAIQRKIKELSGNIHINSSEIKLGDYDPGEKIAKSIVWINQIQLDPAYKRKDEVKECFDRNVVTMIMNPPLRKKLVKFALSSLGPAESKNLITKVNANLFGHLGKSLLNAEYLILVDYSKDLDSIQKACIGYMEDATGHDGEESNRKGEFYSLKSFLKVSWQLQESCGFIKRYLEKESPFNLVHLDSNLEDRYLRTVIIEPEFVGKEQTAFLEGLLSSIIDMTVIDHCFKSTPETVEKLFNLHEQLKKANDPLKFNELGKTVVTAARLKCASMLDQILNDDHHEKAKDIEVNYDYIISSKEKKTKLIEEVDKYRIKVDKCKGNIFLEARIGCKGKLLVLNENEHKLRLERNQVDLLLYYEAVKVGIDCYRKQSPIIKIIKEYRQGDIVREDAVCQVKEYYQAEKIENLSSSVFMQVLDLVRAEIDFLHSQESLNLEQTALLQKDIYFYKEIIDELSIYLRKYKTNIPFYYKPTFEYSFYNCETGVFEGAVESNQIIDYDCEKFTGKFFFASLLCMPMNYDYWEGLYTRHRSNYDRYFSQYEKLFTDNVRLMIEVGEEQIKTTSSKAFEDFNKTLLKISEEISKKHLESTMVTLGIFAAFIAFVTISINMVKIADNSRQFVIFTATFMGCLFLFAIFVKHSPLTHTNFFSLTMPSKEASDFVEEVKKKSIVNSWVNFGAHLLSAFVVLVVTFGILYNCSGEADLFTSDKYKGYDKQMMNHEKTISSYDSLFKVQEKQLHEQDSLIKVMKHKLRMKP